MSSNSSITENLLEYRFLAELGAYLARFDTPMEVLRSDVDRTGHDIVLEANGVLRHVQLKATDQSGALKGLVFAYQALLRVK